MLCGRASAPAAIRRNTPASFKLLLDLSLGQNTTESLRYRERCPACGAAPRRTLYSSPFDAAPIRDYLLAFYPTLTDSDLVRLKGHDFTLQECESCTLVWQRAVPDGRLLELLYDVWAPGAGGGVARHDDATFRRAAAEDVLLVLELAGRSPSTISVLDFGMGWGEWAQMAAAFGCRSYGVEIAGALAEHARNRGVHVLAIDELPGARFDFINAAQVFEHLGDPQATMSRLAQSLTADGWLRVSVPDGRRIASRLRAPDWTAPRGAQQSLNPVAPLEHVNCFTRVAMRRLGESVGLRQSRPRAADFYRATIGLWPPARLARAVVRPPARRLMPQTTTFFRHAEVSDDGRADAR